MAATSQQALLIDRDPEAPEDDTRSARCRKKCHRGAQWCCICCPCCVPLCDGAQRIILLIWGFFYGESEGWEESSWTNFAYRHGIFVAKESLRGVPFYCFGVMLDCSPPFRAVFHVIGTLSFYRFCLLLLAFRDCDDWDAESTNKAIETYQKQRLGKIVTFINVVATCVLVPYLGSRTVPECIKVLANFQSVTETCLRTKAMKDHWHTQRALERERKEREKDHQQAIERDRIKKDELNSTMGQLRELERLILDLTQEDCDSHERQQRLDDAFAKYSKLEKEKDGLESDLNSARKTVDVTRILTRLQTVPENLRVRQEYERKVHSLEEELTTHETYIKDIVGNKGSVTPNGLVALLVHPCSLVKTTAFNALKNAEADSALPTLVESLVHSDASVRKSVAEILGYRASEVYRTSRQSDDQSAIANIEGALTKFVKLLKDHDGQVREEAAVAVRNLAYNKETKRGIAKADCALTTLVGCLGDDKANVRENIAWAMWNLALNNTENQNAIAQTKGALTNLVGCLEDNIPGVRERAAGALRQLAAQNPSNQKAIAETEGALKKLVELLDDVPAVRNQAAGALQILAFNNRKNQKAIAEIEGALPKLNDCLEHDGAVKAEKFRAGARTTREHAAGTLRQLAADDRNQQAVAETEGALKNLVGLLDDQEAGVRKQSAGALSNIAFKNPKNQKAIAQTGNALTKLVGCLRHETSSVREEAAGLLRNLAYDDVQNQSAIAETEGALTKLVELLDDQNPVQKAAAECLWYLTQRGKGCIRESIEDAWPTVCAILCVDSSPSPMSRTTNKGTGSQHGASRHLDTISEEP